MPLQLAQHAGLAQTQEQHLTPQMMQSLKILQASALELRETILQEARQNPVLEVLDPANARAESLDDYDGDGPDDSGERDPDAAEEASRRHDRQLDALVSRETLGDHLESQLADAALSKDLRRAALWIIGNLEDGGWLSVPLEEVPAGAGVTPRTAAEALKLVQGLDPPGVGARNLAECLCLQLADAGHAPDSLPWRLAQGGLELLAERGPDAAAAALGVHRPQLDAALAVLRKLDPRPGLRYSSRPAAIVIPELEFVEDDGRFRAVLLSDGLPEVRLSDAYLRMAESADTPSDARGWLRRRLNSGRDLLRDIEQRRATLLRIGEIIADRQAPYFRNGPLEMRALTLSETARMLDLHETTVGRAVAGKFARSPQGVRELRQFFSTGLPVRDGGAALSQDAIRERLARLVARESPDAPLSDQALAGELRRRGVAIARRTVAKYREQLGIPPAHRRRKAAAAPPLPKGTP